MKRKIFISIKIPEKIKKRLIQAQERWKDLPVKWVPEQNIHLTLVFLGFIEQEMLEEICSQVGNAAENHDIFEISLEKIQLFPDAQKPRLIAVTGESNKELKDLVNDIESALGISTVAKKSFRPHITLGRLRAHKWQMIDPAPEISEKFQITIPIESVDIMASHFSSDENEYALIQPCPLK